MQGIGRLSWWAGVVAIALAVLSRLLVEPVYGIEAHAIIAFAQACFLMAIGAVLLGGEKRS